MLPRCVLAFALVALAVARAVEVDELSLQADDECLSGGQGSCGLAMLQLRRASSGSRAAPEVDFHRSPCTAEESRPCIAGFRQPAGCSRNFSYFWTQYSGCTTSGSMRSSSWCAFDSSFISSRWDYCTSCTEEAKLPLQAWDVIADKLRCMTVTVIVGSANGVSYTFENNQERFRSKSWLASAGKWPAVVAIAGAVHDGSLDWDTRVSEVFTWWESSPEDPRSRITLRHLLQFNSGFTAGGSDQHGFDVPCMGMPRAVFYSSEECAHQIFEQANHSFEPGANFTYNGFHLQIALAMAANRSNKGAAQLLNDNLFGPVGMKSTSVLGSDNPLVDAFMFSTGEDYAKFLEKYLRYEILPKEIVDVIETPAGVYGMPEFAMGHVVAGNDQRWGGNVLPHLNRATGVYALILPKEEDYAAYAGLDGHELQARGQYIGAGQHVWEWIEADVGRLGALENMTL